VSVVPSVSGAAPGAPRDAREERERVRQERADNAAQLDVLRAENTEVEQALADLQANVAGQEAALSDAQQAAAAAEAELAAARRREEETQAQIDGLHQTLAHVAVEAYINAGSLDEASAVLRTDDIETAVQRRELVHLRAGQYQEVLDQLRSLSEDLAIARGQAEQASAAAAQYQNEVAERLRQVESARDQQAQVAAQVDARIEHALAEAANLEALDAQLAQQIAAEQAAIAARNRAASGPAGTASTPIGNVSLTTVRGITVASEIAGQLESMLAAAEADGIVYGGGGYRSSDSQIALRKAHCGSSDYAIYEMSPSSCSPPTARPGQSMHERGLAIDFTYQGRVISSRSSPGFQWLASHAGSYGFTNLPSEPWHWSTNGE
jgi:LAS superfamily LD-carboxypeptidase LdcB